MKKSDLIFWAIFLAIVAWTVVSFVNVNMANVGEAELSSWNLFEIASNLAEAIEK